MRASLAVLALILAGAGVAALGWRAGAALGESPARRVGPPLPGPAGCAPDADCAEEVAFIADLVQALAGDAPGPRLPADLLPPLPPAPAFGPPPGPRFAALVPHGPAMGPAPHPDRP